MTGRQRWGFAIGDLGFNFVWQPIELYLLFFYTEVLGLPAGWAAAIFLVGAAVDFVADPVIGTLADRTAARTGAMRGWLIAAAPVMGVALPLAFAKPELPLAGLGLWALATHLLLRISYSCGNIPYAALTARITDDPREQARLTGLRMQCAAFGGLTVAAVYVAVPGLASAGDPARFFLGAAMLGLLLQPFLWTTWRVTREQGARSTPRPLRLSGEARAMAALVRRGRALRRVLGIVLAAGVMTSLLGKSLLFLFAYDLGDRERGFFVTFVPPLALLTCAPLWVAVSNRWGKPRTLMRAAVLYVVGVSGFALAAFVAAPVGLALGPLALAIVATTGLSVMFWAMVPGTVAEASAGLEDSSGRVYALATTARKLAQSLASPLLALGLLVTLETTGRVLAAPLLAVTGIACAVAIRLMSMPSANRNTAR